MNRQPTNPVKAGVYIAIGVVVFALLLGGAIAGFKSFGRYQKRADRTYIPVGPQGVPLVANINDAQVK
jgi:hypothetical protein